MTPTAHRPPPSRRRRTFARAFTAGGVTFVGALTFARCFRPVLFFSDLPQVALWCLQIAVGVFALTYLLGATRRPWD